jgi:glutaredoxin
VSFFRSRSARSNPRAAAATPPIDPQARLLLEAFAAPELRKSVPDTTPDITRDTARDGLAIGTLARYLALDEDAVRALAEDLLARGWLRHPAAHDDPSRGLGSPDTEHPTQVYAQTEDGILAIAGPLDVTLYTRPGCHLCEEAKKKIAPLLRSAGARLREVNIDADPVLRERYDFDVPVVLLGTRKVAKHRVHIEQFRRQLEEARRRDRDG